jgi:hypothetical protein
LRFGDILKVQHFRGEKVGFFDNLFGGGKKNDNGRHGAIPYGRTKDSGGHDHRTNRGDDRTPAQKKGDENRRKS